MKMTVTTMAHVSSCGPRDRRLVLRQEILRGARDAIVVGPAIHHRKGLAPVALPGRRLRRLPFERGRTPGVATGWDPSPLPAQKHLTEPSLDDANAQTHAPGVATQPYPVWSCKKQIARILVP